MSLHRPQRRRAVHHHQGAIIGEVAPVGSIRFKGREIAGLPSYRIARLGLGYVPENRDIFPGLTVRQNLTLGLKHAKRPGRWRIEDMLAMFPNLAARADTAAGVLSGGESQMLTICRTLMGDPELIMIDEPTEGLAPLLVVKVAELICEIARRGVSILLVEQKLGDRGLRHLGAGLCDGPRRHRVRGHASGAEGKPGGPAGMVGGVTGWACYDEIAFSPADEVLMLSRRPHAWEKSYPAGMRWDCAIATSTLQELLDRAAADYGDRPAIEYCGRRISYGEFHGCAARAAAAFRHIGIDRDGAVALLLPNTPWHPVAFFGALRNGARGVRSEPARCGAGTRLQARRQRRAYHRRRQSVQGSTPRRACQLARPPGTSIA